MNKATKIYTINDITSIDFNSANSHWIENHGWYQLRTCRREVWNAKLTYIQIFVPIFIYLDLGTNHLYLSSNHLYLASNHLHLGTNDLKIGINYLYLGSNDLYLSSNTTICTYLQIQLAWQHSLFHCGRRRIEPRYKWFKPIFKSFVDM